MVTRQTVLRDLETIAQRLARYRGKWCKDPEWCSYRWCGHRWCDAAIASMRNPTADIRQFIRFVIDISLDPSLRGVHHSAKRIRTLIEHHTEAEIAALFAA